MAPTLFSVMLSAMLTDAFRKVMLVSIRYRFDGKLFNLRRLQAKSKVPTNVLDKLLYADDLTENAKIREKNARNWIACQKHVTIFTSQSAQKNPEIHQPAPGKDYHSEWTNTESC